MDIAGWNQRYLANELAGEHLGGAPNSLVVELAEQLEPGDALDLACGMGRNALYLAENDWDVLAVDASREAIRILVDAAADKGLDVSAVVADLESGEFVLGSSQWDLVLLSFYLQPNLFRPVKTSVKPGGVVLAIVHITRSGGEPTAHELKPGDLRTYFVDWEILHEYEGSPEDPAHRKDVAEIVARRPADWVSEVKT